MEPVRILITKSDKKIFISYILFISLYIVSPFSIVPSVINYYLEFQNLNTSIYAINEKSREFFVKCFQFSFGLNRIWLNRSRITRFNFLMYV